GSAAPISLPENAIRLFGALVRACQMAGALGYLSSQSVAYATERPQFGKPIGKCQAIQQQLAALPTQAAACGGSTDYACAEAGALGYLSSQSVAYANERTQFGKPIGKFQAIQQQLAVLSTQAAACGVITDYACAQVEKRGADAAFEIAAAKIRVDDASGIATSIAHQVHGAIGFTYEHSLHFATRRLWAWRAEFGAGSEWAKQL